MPQSETCSFTYCTKPVFVKKTSLGSLCNGHYKQYRILLKQGKPLKLTPLRQYNPRTDSNGATCPWAPKDSPQNVCGRPSWHKVGLCQSHQRQAWDSDRTGSPMKPIRDYQFQMGEECTTDHCHEPAKSKRKCSKCYSQLRTKLRKKENNHAKDSYKEVVATSA